MNKSLDETRSAQLQAAAMFDAMPDIDGLADHYQPRSVAYSLRKMAEAPVNSQKEQTND